MSDVTPIRHAYGSDPAQFGDLHVGLTSSPRGTVVLIHGGFWVAGRGFDDLSAMGRLLAAGGWNAWQIEYRAVGNGGGWPETFRDVAAAIDHLQALRSKPLNGLG